MKDVSHGKEDVEATGLVKWPIDEDSGRFIGATMLDMASQGTWRQVRGALPVHPTGTDCRLPAHDR